MFLSPVGPVCTHTQEVNMPNGLILGSMFPTEVLLLTSSKEEFASLGRKARELYS